MKTSMVFAGSLMMAVILFAQEINAADQVPASVSKEGQVYKDNVGWLDEITVIAKKSARPIRDVANTVTVMDEQRLNERMVQTIRDMMRYEPGVSVSNDAGRFGLNSFSIRGIEGNRVAIELDGVPVSDNFKTGSFSNASRNFVDPEILKRVEVLRGPASTLYGSDALGGVVTFTSKDPFDFLVESGADMHLGLKTAYSGDNRSVLTTLTTAARFGRFESSAVLSGKQGDETENRSEQLSTQSNPADFDSQNMIAKLVFNQSVDNQFRLTIDTGDSERNTDVQSLVGGAGRFASTTRLEGNDQYTRDRVSFDQQFSSVDSFVDKGLWRVFSQASDTRQDTVQDRAPAGRTTYPSRRKRSFSYKQDVIGFEVTLESNIEAGAFEHRLVYGLEATRTDVKEQRDGVQINLNTGVSTNVVIGEVLPVRDFPNSRTQEIGAYLQDEISIANTAMTLLAAVRYESYTLDTQPDALFLEDNPVLKITNLNEHNVSPKLGLLYKASDDVTLFAQYSRGFRSPPMDDVNIGLSIPLFNFVAIPNPDLKPETSDGLELGYRYHADKAAISLAAYINKYDNLIESRVNLGVDSGTGLTTFQSQNRDTAEIVGLEYRGNFDLGLLSEEAGSLILKSSLAYTKGKDTTRHQPLNSIDPSKAVIGLDYDAAGNIWGIELIATHVAAKTEVDETAVNFFNAPAYTIGDVLAYYKISDKAQLNIGLFNIGDRLYWQWADVRKLSEDDPLLDFYSQAGRYGSISLKMQW